MENEAVITNYQNKHLLSTPLYTDMAGGLNTRVSPPQMGINQSQIARNVVYNLASGAISVRDGTSEHNPYPIPLAATSGLFAFVQAKYSTGSRFVAIGGNTGEYDAFSCPHLGGPWNTASGVLPPSIVPPSRRVSSQFYNDTLVCFDGVNPPYTVRPDDATPETDLKITPYYPTAITPGPAPDFLTDCEFVVAYNNKLYAAGSKSAQLSWSGELALDAVAGSVPEFPSENRIAIGGIADGDPIMGLAVAYGHLIVFKRNSIYAVSESGGAPTQTQVGRSIGLVSKHSFCNAENSVWFWGPSGIYSIGSDLTPQYESDYVMPDYKLIAEDFTDDFEDDGAGGNTPSDNRPTLSYNQNLQQVWVSCYKANGGTDPRRNIVYVHDLINKDASGRAAISTYVFYQSSTRNYTPVYMVESVDPNDGSLRLFSVSRRVGPATTLPGPIEVPDNPYFVYIHDVPLSTGELGDDGNLVDFEWQSKAFNLGDPLRLKALRYYTVFGDPRDEVSTQYTNQNYSRDVAFQWNQRHAVSPVIARGSASVCVGAHIYCFGGLDSSGNYLSSVRVYSIADDTWTNLPLSPLPVGLAFAEAVYDGSYIYIVGGATATQAATRKIYRCSITSPGVLSGIAEFYTDALTYPRVQFGAVVDGSFLYCFGGAVSTPASVAYTFEKINLGSGASSSLAAPYSGSLGGATLVYDATATGYIWLFYGTLIYRYNIAAGTWVASTVPLPSGVVYSVANLYNGVIYVMGGAAYLFGSPEGGAALTTCYAYTPSYAATPAGTVAVQEPLASARKLFGKAFDSTTGLAYIIGGTGIPIRAYFESTDDFKTYVSTDVDIVLNVRSLVPTDINYLARYWAITFKGRISEGIARVIGFCLDYVMFQRRG